MLFPGRCCILAFSAVLTRSEGITRLAATLRPLLHRRPAGFLIVNDLLLEAGGIKIDAKICCLLDFYVNSGANMQNTRGDVVVKWKV